MTISRPATADLTAATYRPVSFPIETPPAAGACIEVAPGILWARLALPFRLNHVNIFLIEDGDGYAAVDTGIADDATREAWKALLSGPLKGKRLTRLIVTHHHPDHIGLAGWLCAEFDIPLLTSQTGFLACNNISLSPNALGADAYRTFYRAHGMSETAAEMVATQGNYYLRMVTPLPLTFFRLVAGEKLKIGARVFDILSGDGHAPEQIMLYDASAKLLLAADQVLARITPNVSVWAVEPDGDPLGLYTRSLGALAASLPEETLILPGHELPFYGLHTRVGEILAHHEERCELIVSAVRSQPMTVADLVPVLFPRALDPHQMSFAFSETHAHVNLLIHREKLVWTKDADGILRVVLPTR
ncbi:MBL fold metallo-hydrolase [Rhizobium sp. C4]|uniref:MBL fold metallo-hydrolase n=1 Tax=Rhizobium sp. C4 TaxID=1349800 RepID=UPI001E35108C|nr:MBL fold metallo-hydrolase [Rhizobium sp. C4]MCD2174338.1 MBL fold metallo-hydrolase [Rhizobium sp. C4]